MDQSKEEAYNPEPEFQEDSREPLVDINLTDSTELWLIQWPLNQLPDFSGKEISLNLQNDGYLGSFGTSSGKLYDVVSSSALEPDATVFLSSTSGAKVVGKISRRVSLVHYTEPEEFVKQEAEKKQKRLQSNSYLSRGTVTHSGKHKRSLSEVETLSNTNSQKRRRMHEHGGSRGHSDLGLGRGHSGHTS